MSMKENKLKVVLASASPRRKELIKLIFDDFTVLPAECDETLPDGINAVEAVEYLSRIKNNATKELLNGDELVISADTIVVVDGEILGKPTDKDDARRMIKLLNGRIHQVYTGITISQGEKSVTFNEKTDVEFLPLTEKEIEDYISTSEPYDKAYVSIWDTKDAHEPEWKDKAGAYGIQGKASLLVKGIKGDYFNVVGFPVSRLNRELSEFLRD